MDKSRNKAKLARQTPSVLRGSGVTIWKAVTTTVAAVVLTPLVGSAIGAIGTTVLSTVIGVPAGRVLDSILKHGRRAYYEIIYGERVTNTLVVKLTDEFRSSILSYDINIAEELGKGFKLLQEAGIEPALNHDKLNQSVGLHLNVKDEETKVTIDAAKKISELREIRIKVPAVHPAAVATFKRIFPFG